MHKRIRELRENLNLSQTAFAARVGMTRSVISNIELGLVEIPEYRISAIVKEFNVNRKWLETGEGDMFLPQSDHAIVDQWMREYNGSPVFRALMTTYLQLSEPRRRLLGELIEEFASAVLKARAEGEPEPDVGEYLTTHVVNTNPDEKAQ